MTKALQFDVVIVGGGLAGLSLYLALSRHGINAAVVECAKLAVDSQQENRGIALSKVSLDILSHLGLGSACRALSYPLEAIHVTEQGCFGSFTLRAKQAAVSHFGAVIDYNRLTSSIANACSEYTNGLFDEAKMEQACQQGQHWQVEIAQGENHRFWVHAPLLVAADGLHSPLRHALGINAKMHDYQQKALVTNISIQGTHQGVAYERFTPEGVLALLPFGQHKMKCVWTGDNQTVDHWMARSEASYLQILQKAFGYRLGAFIQLSQRITYPIWQLQAESLVGWRSVLLGSAANHMHPIAAQGFNVTMRDVAYLTELLFQAKKGTQDFGAPALLQSYTRLRQAEHQRVQQSIHQLHRLFHSQQPALRHIRRMGLMVGEYLPWVKHWITKQGMQGGQTPPQLAFGELS